MENRGSNGVWFSAGSPPRTTRARAAANLVTSLQQAGDKVRGDLGQLCDERFGSHQVFMPASRTDDGDARHACGMRRLDTSGRVLDHDALLVGQTECR